MATLLWAFFTYAPVLGAEPNETFATATILAPGVRSVLDGLTPGHVSAPDTLLGVRSSGGALTTIDDNSSTLGNGFASGVTGILTNDGDISFSVTGKGDNAFTGSHTQTGDFDVEIEIVDSLGEIIDTFFTGVETLHPGQVKNFSFSGDPAWVGATYSANVDNSLTDPTDGDVDFFTFTDLPKGASFVAQTSDPSSGINTYLFQYNALGNVIALDDNSGVDDFSLLSGKVPAVGKLTFAVTGFGDTFRNGAHLENGSYGLALAIDTGIPADFDQNGLVNQADLAVWQTHYGQDAGADADGDGDSDGRDFLFWQRQLGTSLLSSAVRSVPEPGTVLIALQLFALTFYRGPRGR
jgi:hypothetical protein